ARIKNANRRQYRVGLRLRLPGVGPTLGRLLCAADTEAKGGGRRRRWSLAIDIGKDRLRMPRTAGALQDAGVAGFSSGIVTVHHDDAVRRKGQRLHWREIVDGRYVLNSGQRHRSADAWVRR